MRPALKILLPLVVLFFAALVSMEIMGSREDPPKVAQRAPAPLVRSLIVEAADEALLVDSQGTVTAPTKSLLTPEVSGRIEWVAPSFVAGGFFEQGAELVRLDKRNHEIAVVLARAEVARAELSLELEIQEGAVASAEWDALEDDPAPDLVARKPQGVWARAELAAAKARLVLAELDLERTSIRAPYAGRVASRSADLGQVVGPGTALAVVYGIDRAEVRLPIADRDLAFLDIPLSTSGAADDRPQVPVTLSTVFAAQRWTWSGHIVRVEAEIDPGTRMLHLVAEVDDPYGRRSAGDSSSARPPLSVGLFVSAELQGRVAQNVMALPRSALRTATSVAVIDDENRLRFRDVVILRTERDRVLVTEGVAVGERVCLSTLEAAVDGMTVRTEVDGGLDGGVDGEVDDGAGGEAEASHDP